MSEHERLTAGLDLYWIPLGAGARVVRTSGRIYETIIAAVQRRPRRGLYHSALVAHTPEGAYSVEMTPVPGAQQYRGVVGGGAVGSEILGRFRVFRYEIRRWRDGVIPDLGHAVESPVRISSDTEAVRRTLDLVARVPTPVWGRDELDTGEMWNSNSVVSWVLTRAGLLERAGEPPHDGRAPGWDAGVLVATRPLMDPRATATSMKVASGHGRPEQATTAPGRARAVGASGTRAGRVAARLGMSDLLAKMTRAML